MRNVRSPDMDKEAANYGDRLKHALLLEILERAHGWSDLTYAETHAGAGMYRAEAQAAQESNKQHIRLLREEVERVGFPEGGSVLGAPHLKWLKQWWKDTSNNGTYPGSALTAVRWLRENRPEHFEIRLTEGDEQTCERLRRSLGIPPDGTKHGSFQDHLDWLTETDNLVLLVDPFGIVTEFGEECRSCGLERGRIDHDVVKKILGRCAAKERAIVHFWWSSGQEYKHHCEATTCLFAGWRGRHGEVSHREFHDKHNHRSTLFGIGEGARIVDGLPGRKRWEQTWLKSVIYEKPRRRSK